MRRLRALGAAAVLAAALLPIGGAPPACAEGSASAALVVDTGERVLRLCVALPRASVTGIDLIELAAEQHGLAYSLGYGGQAVCSLAGVGPEGADCFAEYPRFWGYWRGDGEGGWTWSSVGAASTTVEAGDVEGWSWGEGDDGTSHPRPPATRYEQVCAEPSPSPASPSPRPSRSPAAASPQPSPSPAQDRAGAREREREEPREATPATAPLTGWSAPVSPSPSPPEPPPEPSPAAVPSSPGIGGPAALGLAGALAAAALVLRRRRRR